MGRRITWRPRLVVVKYSQDKSGAELLRQARRYVIECLAQKDREAACRRGS